MTDLLDMVVEPSPEPRRTIGEQIDAGEIPQLPECVQRTPGVKYTDGYEQGVCRVCGEPSMAPTGTYCADHKTRQPRDGSGAQSVKRPARSPKGAPTADEWSSKVFDKVVILLTALYAGSMVRRYGLNDPNDAIADSLTMTDDEARRVAKPLGRFVAGTGVSKRYGRKVLDNSDLLDAGFAIYDYMDRVNHTLKEFATDTPLAVVRNIQPTETEASSGETIPTPANAGIAFDAGGLSGWNFVP